MDTRLDLLARLLGSRLRPGIWAKLGTWLLVALSVVLTLRFLNRAYPAYLPKDWSQAHEFDSLIDWKGARLFVRDGSPYSPAGLRELSVIGVGHPPTTPFWFLPLARVEKPVVAELVDLFACIFLAVQAFLCARELRFPAPLAVASLVFSWVLTTGGMQLHFHDVQLSEHIAFSCVLSWLYLRRGREIPAGISLGVAATIKLFPGVLMLMLLLARRYRAFVAASLTFGGVALVMTAGFGIDCWPLFFHQQPLISYDWLGSPRNAAIQGIVLRLMYPTCVAPARPQQSAAFIAAAIGIALFLLAWLLGRRAFRYAREVDPRAIDVPFALFTLLAVFGNAWVWEHYSVLAIQPVFVLVATWGGAFRQRARAWLDERLSHGALIRAGLVLLFGLGCLAFVLSLFSMQIGSVDAMLELWHSTGNPWYDRQIHFFEIVNWAPWPILTGLCLFSMRYHSPGPRPDWPSPHHARGAFPGRRSLPPRN